MKNIWNVVLYTLRESLARKVFIAFAIISTLAIAGFTLFMVFANPIQSITMGMEKSKVPIGEIMLAFESGVASSVLSLGLLLSIFATASFIPDILEKGTVDLFLSKPMSRMQLLLGRTLGATIVVFANVFYLVFGLWLVFSFGFGLWQFSFLWLIPTTTLVFLSLFAVIALFGVLTRSSVPGMMAAYLIFLIVSPLLTLRIHFYNQMKAGDFTKWILDTIYYIVPKTSELFSDISIQLVLGKPIAAYQPIYTTVAFVFIIIGLSIFLFEKKDF